MSLYISKCSFVCMHVYVYTKNHTRLLSYNGQEREDKLPNWVYNSVSLSVSCGICLLLLLYNVLCIIGQSYFQKHTSEAVTEAFGIKETIRVTLIILPLKTFNDI